jgi:hypothetical protein
MIGRALDLSTLPPGVLVASGVLLIAELVLDVIALVDLYRRPIERVALGSKWAWVAIVVLVNFLGAILYLVLGRKPAPRTEEPPQTPMPARTRANIADALYGPRDDSTQP